MLTNVVNRARLQLLVGAVVVDPARLELYAYCRLTYALFPANLCTVPCYLYANCTVCNCVQLTARCYCMLTYALSPANVYYLYTNCALLTVCNY